MHPSEHTRWFIEEIQPHEAKLRAWLRAKFPQLNDYDDVVQDAYLRLFRAKRCGQLEHPKAYLYTTARNAALDRCRRGKIVVFEPISRFGGTAEDLPATSTDLPQTIDRELDALSEAIRTLPERCRTVLVLRKQHGLSHREIAERLGISPHTVNAQLTAAMLKCRAFFKERGLLDPNSDAT